VEQDRMNTGPSGGIFRGCFRTTARRPMMPMIRARPIRDAEDGVERCPSCTWELEDGRCESCGYPFREDSEYLSDTDGMGHSDLEYGSGVSMDDDLFEALAEGDIEHRHLYGGDDYDDGESSVRIIPVGPPQRRDYRNLASNVDQHAPSIESPPASFYDGTDYGSDDEDGGSSLEGFVVNDEVVQDLSRGSSVRSLQWETDEGSGPEDIQTLNSEDEPLNQADDDSDPNEASFTTAQYDLEDDSDECPTASNSRRQMSRRVAGSTRASSSGASQAPAAVRVGSHPTYDTSQNQHNIPHRSPATGRHGRRSRGVPIEIESDSDSPVPPRRQRRRRAIQNRISSEEDSDVDASSGTVLGRQSPRPGPRPRNARINTFPASQTSNASSPILRVSDAPASDEENFPSPSERSQSILPTAFTNQSSTTGRRGSHASIPPNHGTQSPPQSSSTFNVTSNNHLSPHSQTQRNLSNRLESPLPPRPNRHGPPRPSISPMRREERFYQGVRDRQAQKDAKKAERRRLKAERDRRQRTQAGPSNASLQDYPASSTFAN